MNEYIRAVQCPIPNVRNLLEKAQHMVVALDFDMKSAFHQIIIDAR